MTRNPLLLSLLLAAACSGGTQNARGGGGGGGGGDVAGDPGGGAAADPKLAARTAFDNPGGMWMPRQMLEQKQLLEDLGLEIDAAALSDPTRPPLSAVVSLGGCTGSFVSPEGLIVTNHHCVRRALQFNSTAEQNLVENGFLAKTRADEKSAGPAQRVYVAQKITDVSDQILDGLAEIQDPAKRFAEIEKREKALIAACEKDRPAVKCTTSPFFRGLEWQLLESLELRDIRLVYVPHRAIGNYGGEVDNWAWPRHTGDFAFFRAYVGKDGQPAEYATDNVPFQPAAHLTIGTEGVKAADLVFLAGYPARTNRQLMASEMAHTMEWTHPRSIEKAEQQMAILAELQKLPGETAIKAGVARQYVQNRLEKYSGILEGVKGTDLVERKLTEEKAFRTWAAEDPARRKYVDALDALEQDLAEGWAIEAKEEAWKDVVTGSTLLETALFFARWTDEQRKPDAERKLGFQERDRASHLAKQKMFGKSFDRTLDRAMWKLMIQRATRDPGAREWLPPLLGLQKGAKLDDKAIDKALDGFYAKTTLEDEKVRMGLMTAKHATLKKSKDPFIRLAMKLYPQVRKNEARDEARRGERILLSPVYAEGFLAFKGGRVAPDANRTLRVAYGTVRGYQPAPGKEVYAPFTKVTEIPKKDTGQDPFDAPRPLLDAIAAGNWGPYAAKDLGTVPVAFLADLDITGGNSGSAVLDARGRLVGLAFDGNYEGLASDVVFKGETTRSIVADIRYVLWVADGLDQADDLLKEMGVPPAL